MEKRRNVLRALCVSVVLISFVIPISSSAQTVPDIRVPLERYSISPYLQESYLILQGTTLPDVNKIDLSLGIKYMRQPWRLYGSSSDFIAPVEDHFQIRPAVSYAFRNYFDIAVVVPLSYQTAGSTGSTDPTIPTLTTVTNQDGFHLLDPELFLRIPIFHKRKKGFGFAFASQLTFPFGSDAAFVGYHAWQGTLMAAADWRWNNLGLLLNTGVLLRETHVNLNTSIGHEFFIRPGLSYTLDFGSYAIAFSVEGNIATGIGAGDYWFANENDNAFQMLFSVQLMPSESSSGVYAAIGGGSRLQGGGYGVPIANVDSRIGYSIQWKSKPKDAIAVGDSGKTPGKQPGDGDDTGYEKPSGPLADARTPDGDSAEEVGELPREVPGEGSTTTSTDISGTSDTGVAVASIVPPEPGGETIEVAGSFEPTQAYGGKGIQVIKVEFSPNMPSKRGVGMSSGSSAIPESARDQLRSQKAQIAKSLRAPNARVIIVGFADKCFEGIPYLGNQFNKELSQRRAEAMRRLFTETMQSELSGVEIKTLAMGRMCANPKCRCSTPDMSECANDRRVEVVIDYGDFEEYQCPGGGYWLAR
ncbi:MAG: OmpA family protein [Deltaproteobacteria bacterium]|nr:OmpA family protein [Deltaproteobacteria bacterium]MBW1872596.1 OmpA family protein [Deltaproteobacteria bacterium]